MRLLINTASVMRGGSVQVAYSFIKECAKIDGHEYGLIAGPGLQKLMGNQDFLKRFTIYEVNQRPAQSPLKAFRGNVFDGIEEDFRPDVVFTTSGPAYWKSRAPHLIGYNLPHYIYPESPYFQRIGIKERLHWTLWKQLIRFFYNRDADALVVQTDDVKKRVGHFLKCSNITTVSNTCGSHFLAPQVYEAVPFHKEERKEYLLYLTAYYPHKNLEIINQVAPILEKKFPEKFVFVVTLPEDVYSRIIAPEVVNSVINIGPVKPEQCPALYRLCDYTFMPTLLECFSASYAESMAMNRVILTSNMGFAETVCQDAAVYFDPTNPEAIAKSIIQISLDENRRKELIMAGRVRLKNMLSASERAKCYLELCKILSSISK